jgi:hypothetical protein
VHIEVAQRLLPLCECIGSRTLLPTRVSERAEGARSLERNLWVLRVAWIVLGVVFVRVTVGCDDRLCEGRVGGRELARVRDYDGIYGYIAVGCRVALDSADCEKKGGQVRCELGVKEEREAMMTYRGIFHE